MFTIRQHDDRWELIDEEDGTTESNFRRYDHAVEALQFLLAAVTISDGLLAEEWVAPVAFLSQPTGDGRDFSETIWSWRDPETSLLPLMLHTETDVGHFGAHLAGFVTEISEEDGTGTMRGRFYDSDEGKTARDLLLNGRRFGVSVDPGGGTVAVFRCVETGEDGECLAEEMIFESYEVIGLTMTPFPGFADAFVVLASDSDEEVVEPEAIDEEVDEAIDEDVDDDPEAMAAASSPASLSCCEPCRAASVASKPAESRSKGLGALGGRISALRASAAPNRPPSEWFADPQLDRLTAPTISESGRIVGHLAPWGQCHTGYQGECVMTPRSLTSYSYFRTGYVLCSDGTEVATGPLTVGGGHASELLSFRGAIEHYDQVGSAVADIAVGEDAYGIWFAGAIRPTATDDQIRVLRASPPSGDWRPIGTGLELVAAAAVNSQGFPVARVASSGRVLALVAAGHGVMAALSVSGESLDVEPVRDGSPTAARIAKIERQVDEMRSIATAPARLRLRQVAVDRLRHP